MVQKAERKKRLTCTNMPAWQVNKEQENLTPNTHRGCVMLLSTLDIMMMPLVLSIAKFNIFPEF